MAVFVAGAVLTFVAGAVLTAVAVFVAGNVLRDAAVLEGWTCV